MKFPWYIWIPRILIVLVALFMAMFSLDILSAKATFLQKVSGMLVHNIPTLLLLLMLVVTWKKPLWGGFAFLVLGSAMGIWLYLNFKRFFAFDYLSMVFPTLICSVLFFLAHFNKHEIKSDQTTKPEEPIAS